MNSKRVRSDAFQFLDLEAVVQDEDEVSEHETEGGIHAIFAL